MSKIPKGLDPDQGKGMAVAVAVVVALAVAVAGDAAVIGRGRRQTVKNDTRNGKRNQWTGTKVLHH